MESGYVIEDLGGNVHLYQFLQQLGGLVVGRQRALQVTPFQDLGQLNPSLHVLAVLLGNLRADRGSVLISDKFEFFFFQPREAAQGLNIHKVK